MAARGRRLQPVIRVDGGMSASDWTMQFLADMLAAPVDRPAYLETTSTGAAYLAGMAAGLYPDAETFAAGWRAERRFLPAMPEARRAAKYIGWQDAVDADAAPAITKAAQIRAVGKLLPDHCIGVRMDVADHKHCIESSGKLQRPSGPKHGQRDYPDPSDCGLEQPPLRA